MPELETAAKPIRRIKTPPMVKKNKIENKPAPAATVPSIAHLAGAWKDDPFFDELMESIAEDRRAVSALYAEEAEAEAATKAESKEK